MHNASLSTIILGEADLLYMDSYTRARYTQVSSADEVWVCFNVSGPGILLILSCAAYLHVCAQNTVVL